MGRVRVVVLVLVVLLWSCLAAVGCKVLTAPEATMPEPEVEVTVDPRIFTVFAGMVAVGYGDERGDSRAGPLREQVLQATADWSPEAITGLDQFLVDLNVYGPDSLTWNVINMSGPPGFSGWYPSATAAAIQNLWAESEPIYASVVEAESGAASALLPQASDAIRRALVWVGMRESPYALWRIVLNPLAEPGFSSSCADAAAGTAWIVVGPPDELRVEAVAYEAFKLLLPDETFSELQASGDLERFQSSHDWAAAFRPWSGYDLKTYVKENLAKALANRVAQPGGPGVRLDEAWDEGFVLAPAFYEALPAGDGSGSPVDIGAVLETADVQGMMKERTRVGQWRLCVLGGTYDLLVSGGGRSGWYYPEAGHWREYVWATTVPAGTRILAPLSGDRRVGSGSVTATSSLKAIDGEVWTFEVEDVWLRVGFGQPGQEDEVAVGFYPPVREVWDDPLPFFAVKHEDGVAHYDQVTAGEVIFTLGEETLLMVYATGNLKESVTELLPLLAGMGNDGP